MAADVIITGSIVYGLTRSKTGWHRTDKVSAENHSVNRADAGYKDSTDEADHQQARPHDHRRPNPAIDHRFCLFDRV